MTVPEWITSVWVGLLVAAAHICVALLLTVALLEVGRRRRERRERRAQADPDPDQRRKP